MTAIQREMERQGISSSPAVSGEAAGRRRSFKTLVVRRRNWAPLNRSTPSPDTTVPDPHEHYGRCVKTIPATPPAPEPPSPPAKPGDKRSRRQLPRDLFLGEARREREAAENRKLAPIEKEREMELILEAQCNRHPGGPVIWQSAVWNKGSRQKEIERCEEEIRKLRAQPADIPDRAYLVELGVRDWQAEKALLQGKTGVVRNLGREVQR